MKEEFRTFENSGLNVVVKLFKNVSLALKQERSYDGSGWQQI